MSGKSKAFKIKKSMMVHLAVWLNSQSLEGRLSRVRTRFVTKLADGMAELEAERKEIINKYVEKEKGEDGEMKWKTHELENGQTEWVVSPEKMESLNKEIEEMYQEEFVIALTPETEADLSRIKDIILDTNYKFGPEESMSLQEKNEKIIEANNYQVWCEAVEALELN